MLLHILHISSPRSGLHAAVPLQTSRRFGVSSVGVRSTAMSTAVSTQSSDARNAWSLRSSCIRNMHTPQQRMRGCAASCTYVLLLQLMWCCGAVVLCPAADEQHMSAQQHMYSSTAAQQRLRLKLYSLTSRLTLYMRSRYRCAHGHAYGHKMP